jgi:hypothetical protein
MMRGSDARIENIQELLIREDSVAAIRDGAKKDTDEGKEVCKGVWNEETTDVVSVAVHRVPTSDLGSNIVPGDGLPSVHGYMLP